MLRIRIQNLESLNEIDTGRSAPFRDRLHSNRAPTDKNNVKNLRKYFPVAIGSLVLLVLIFLFQNMTLVEFASLNIAKVDEGSRRDQARELLGAYYRGSSAQKLEGQQYMNYLVFKKIDQALRAKWKGSVPTLAQAIIAESQKHEFDPVFILAVIQTESTFNPEARGSAGEIGLMQILPKTGEWIAKKYRLPWKGVSSLLDPVSNVRIGIQYFAHLRSEFDGAAYHYLPAYNMGPKNMRRVEREIGSVDADGRVLKRDYAMRVMKNYFAIYQMASDHTEIEKYARAEGDPAEAGSQVQ